MKIIITSLIIGALFVSSQAGLYIVKSLTDEAHREERSLATDIMIDSTSVSDIEIISKYSADKGLLEMTCNVTGEELSYHWNAADGTLRNNEVAVGNVLRINQVTKENDRIFCCEASNTEESVKKCERLQPLVLTSDPVEHNLDDSAEMFCKVIGTDTNYDIKWKRVEDLPLPNNAIVNGGLLKIPKLARTDTGNYSCIGLFHGKTAFHSEIPLKVVAPPEIIELRITGLDGDYDNNVTIKCITQPDETIKYEWKAHTEGSTNLHDNEKAEGDLLSIHNFKKDNEGTFCCVTTNALGTMEKCVTISPLVLKVYPKESNEVMPGDSVTLQCHESTEYSNVEYHWEREDGRQLASNVFQSSNGSLTITDTKVEEEGFYKCSGTKGVLSASATVEIKVKTLPEVEIVPSTDGNMNVKLGDQVKLTCNAKGHPEPNVQWQKFLPETDSYEIVEPATVNSVVHDVRSLSGNEAAVYLCLAENSAGSSNKSVRVVIKPLVLEVYPKEFNEVMSGGSVTLQCRESTGYSNIEYHWEREDGRQFASNVFQSANGSLTITNIEVEEKGFYKCSATKGELSASTTAEIDVKLSPPSEIQIETNYITSNTYLFRCHATGEELSYQWTVQNRSWLHNELLDKNELFFSGTIKENDGIFCCNASNAAGELVKCSQLPTSASFPMSQECDIGNKLEMSCSVFGQYSSDIHLRWYKADSPLSNETTLGVASIKITSLTEVDGSNYNCRGSLSDGTLIFESVTPVSLISSAWCKIYDCPCRPVFPDTSSIQYFNRLHG